MPISSNVRKWYDTIDKLPKGAKILIDMGYSGGAEAEMAPYAVAVQHHIFKKGGLKSIFIAMHVEGPTLWRKMMGEVTPDQYGAKYGIDYIMIGYVAGVETAMAAIGKDFRKTVPVDYNGDPLEKFPIMEGIKDATSFDLLISYTVAGDIGEGWVRQWIPSYRTPYLLGCVASMLAVMEPFARAGQIVSLVAGADSAQYELLVGKPSRGVRSADVMTATHVLLLAFIIIGNIAYWKRKMSGG